MIYARWGQPVRALWYFNRAVAMNRGGTKAYYHRGLLFLAIGSPERAIGDFSATLQNQPEHIDARINRSIVYTLTGRHEQALRDLEQAVEMGADREILEQQIFDARVRADT
jgi:tetratricopeptide (TPR) repeat protein